MNRFVNALKAEVTKDRIVNVGPAMVIEEKLEMPLFGSVDYIDYPVYRLSVTYQSKVAWFCEEEKEFLIKQAKQDMLDEIYRDFNYLLFELRTAICMDNREEAFKVLNKIQGELRVE